METQEIPHDLLPPEKKVTQTTALNMKELESLPKSDLVHMLTETRTHCVRLEELNQKLEESVEKLEKALTEQTTKCKRLEADKIFLRNNIKKASDNWFERKAKLSEGDSDIPNVGENDSNEESDNDSGENESKNMKRGIAHIIIAEETVKLFSELKFKDEQLELSERRSGELGKRVKDYEKVIDDQEVIIHGLEEQLDTYFNDNQMMSKQLAELYKLFTELENINEKQVQVPAASHPVEDPEEHLPTADEFNDMSGSVARTYMKLKELIYEKKSLVTEIERLRTLNIELQSRVSQQETRLISVSDALQTTWLLVSNLKDEHEKIHTAETILRYDLKQKREILHKLRNELECSREQWHIIRQKNSETEREWNILREELNERRKLRKLAELNGNQPLTHEEIEGAVGGVKSPVSDDFEPPIDLLVDMGIEYGVVNADDEESTTVVALIDGQDVHEHRLRNLEEQCCFLYSKLMTSTSRALTLASHLSSLHEHYAASDEEDEEEEEEEDDDDSDNENLFYNQENLYETEMISPDSESYDTAYVSEADGADSASGVVENNAIVNEGDTGLTEISNEDSSDLMDDCGDHLSRRLITFLPRKIEILRAENKKLEEKLELQLEEKLKIETTLTAAVESERRQRRQLEQQLSHLGKCVDELKLERNGKISELEEKLRNKIEQVEQEEREHVLLQDEFEIMKEKFEERGALLQLSASQLQQTVKESEKKLTALQEEIQNLKKEALEKRLKGTNVAQQPLTETCKPPIGDATCSDGNGSNSHIATPSRNLPSLECQAISNISQKSLKFEDELQARNNEAIADCQLRRMILLTKSCLRLPFDLSLESVLCWSFNITSQELKFSITFDDNSSNHPETRLQSITEQEHSANTVIQEQLPEREKNQTILRTDGLNVSKELLLPHVIRSSNSPITGRIYPRISGRYSLIFQNHTTESVELFLKLWVETASDSNI